MPLQERSCGSLGHLVVRQHMWDWCLSFASDMQVLVTGSLYLVGDVLKHLKKFI